MTKDEALKLSMEAMEITGGFDVEINAIKEALMSGTDGAQPEPWEKFCDSNCVWTDHHPDCKLAEQEPVAWRIRCTDPMRDWVLMYRYPKTEEQFSNMEIQSLYTTPPQRKPLKLDELWRVFTRSGLSQFHQRDSVVEYKYQKCIEEFARAIEAAHGIKELKEYKK